MKRYKERKRKRYLSDDPLRAATEEEGRRIAEAMSQPVELKLVSINRKRKA